MREGFRTDATCCHALQAVVTDSGGRAQRRVDIAAGDCRVILGGVSPDACKTVGLQFEPDREWVLLVGIGLLKSPNLRFDAKDLLNVVTNLVSNDVGLCELARSSEALTQFVEEAEVKIDFLVFGTVERPDGSLGQAATRWNWVTKENEMSVMVGAVGEVGQNAIPSILDIAENDISDEVGFGLLLSIALGVGNGSDGLSGCLASAGEEREEVGVEDEA